MMRVLPLLALSAVACQGDAQTVAEHIARVENELLPPVLIVGQPTATSTLAERMALHAVPGVSIAVIDDGEIEWARGYGMADVDEGRPVTPNTLFQAASISKPVAATAMLTLVEDGTLHLDQDVNAALASWQVPVNRFTTEQPVTLRRLVTHSAGMTVRGFPGYAHDQRVPSTIEVLDGSGNTPPIRVDTTPGAIWRYSGGGYTVMQQLLTDVTGESFPALMRQRVLGPAGMTQSSYEQPLPEARRGQAATGYRSDGAAVSGKWHTYPEMAAAGLWTTPSDLARWAIAIQRSAGGGSGHMLSRELAQQMLRPDQNGWGLGPAIHPSGTLFHHSGGNEGFRCRLVAFIEGGRGAVIMTNSDNGADLVGEILGTLAVAYDWPALKPVEKVVVEVDAAIYEELAGRYELPFGIVTIAVEDGRLWAEVPGQRRSELLPESEAKFFARDTGTEITLIREGGRIVAFRVFGMRAERVQ